MWHIYHVQSGLQCHVLPINRDVQREEKTHEHEAQSHEFPAKSSGPRTVRVVGCCCGGTSLSEHRLASYYTYFSFINSLWGGIHSPESASFLLLDVGYMHYLWGGIQHFFLSMAQFFFMVGSSVSKWDFLIWFQKITKRFFLVYQPRRSLNKVCSCLFMRGR